MKSNPELRQRIVDLYSSGISSLNLVAKQVGLRPETVLYHLHKAGAVMRKRGQNITNRMGCSDPKLAAREHPSVYDIAWAAGIYEGEGCVAWSSNRTNMAAQVMVAQKDPWLCGQLKGLFGGSITIQQQRTSGRSTTITMYYWRLTGARARGFMMTIYKFLSPRRQERIREALAA